MTSMERLLEYTGLGLLRVPPCTFPTVKTPRSDSTPLLVHPTTNLFAG